MTSSPHHRIFLQMLCVVTWSMVFLQIAAFAQTFTPNPTATPQPTLSPTPVPWVARQSHATNGTDTLIFFGGTSYQLNMAFTRNETPADFNVLVTFYEETPYGVRAPTLNGVWTIDAEDLNGTLSHDFNATLFFYYSDDLLSEGLAEDQQILGAARAFGDSAKWFYYGGIPNHTNNYVIVQDVTEFSKWTLGSPAAFTSVVPLDTPSAIIAMAALLSLAMLFWKRRETGTRHL